MLALLPAAVWRLLSEASLPQRRGCLALFRLTSLRLRAGAAPLLYVLGEYFLFLGDHFEFVVAKIETRLYSRHQRAHVL
jgi:hypothetical protein